MTIEELSEISCIKEKTVRQRIHEIKGARQNKDGVWIIPNGSRYPYDIHRYKLDNIEKRRLALLDATYKFRYIDDKILKMSKESFNVMLEELLSVGYIRKNNSKNKYGANRFDTTLGYERVLHESNYKKKKMISDAIASAAGQFTGAIIGKLL